MGLLLLTLTIWDLALQIWLFIEIQFNEFTFAKLDRVFNPTKNTSLKNLNIFIYTKLFFFSSNICECL